jgi:hypothetical protein
LCEFVSRDYEEWNEERAEEAAGDARNEEHLRRRDARCGRKELDADFQKPYGDRKARHRRRTHRCALSGSVSDLRIARGSRIAASIQSSTKTQKSTTSMHRRTVPSARASGFVAQGGDWGANVTQELALLAPGKVIGIHTNMPGTVPADILAAAKSGAKSPVALSGDELQAFEQLRTFYAQELGYAVE